MFITYFLNVLNDHVAHMSTVQGVVRLKKMMHENLCYGYKQ